MMDFFATLDALRERVELPPNRIEHTLEGIGAAIGLVALFVAELLSFLSRSGEAAPSRALEAA